MIIDHCVLAYASQETATQPSTPPAAVAAVAVPKLVGLDPRWVNWDTRNLRSYLQSNAATAERKQKELSKAVTRHDLLTLVIAWGVSYMPKEDFREQASGFAGVRRRVIDVYQEAQTGNVLSVQLFIEQGEDLERRAPNNRRRTVLHCVLLGNRYLAKLIQHL
jgi:hypothetical protein